MLKATCHVSIVIRDESSPVRLDSARMLGSNSKGPLLKPSRLEARKARFGNTQNVGNRARKNIDKYICPEKVFSVLCSILANVPGSKNIEYYF